MTHHQKLLVRSWERKYHRLNRAVRESLIGLSVLETAGVLADFRKEGVHG